MPDKTKRVLIVDDDPGLCHILESQLKARGFSVQSTYDGHEALSFVRAQMPDIIILDAMMPSMGGFEFLERLRIGMKKVDVPVIILTSLKDRSSIEKGFNSKADFYLPKPFEIENLMNFILTLVGAPSETQVHSLSLKKDIAGLGLIEYKIASTVQELESAFALVYDVYLKRGYIQADHYKSALRVSAYNLLPQTVTFIGKQNGEVVITTTVILDSFLGLPMDTGYGPQMAQLRKSGRKLAEVGSLVIKSGLFKKNHFSMFNFNKLDFMFTVFKMLYHFLLFKTDVDDMCIVTDPRMMVFKFLPFDVIGEVKYYGFDFSSINKKAAIAKKMDLRRMRENFDKPGLLGTSNSFNKIFMNEKVPEAVYEAKLELTLEDYKYFFVQKSDVWRKLTKQEKASIISINPALSLLDDVKPAK